MPKYVQIARTNDIFRPKNNNKDSVNVYDVFLCIVKYLSFLWRMYFYLYNLKIINMYNVYMIFILNYNCYIIITLIII